MYKGLSDRIIESVYVVHKALGPGLMENPYRNALFNRLFKTGLSVEKEVSYQVRFEGDVVGQYFADIVVEKKIIVEVKAVRELSELMEAQLINYLRISGLQVGYLVNFRGSSVVWKRLVSFSP